ncbi:hypothetical protein scyTo_0017830 [Scyliorhinus torazame]|uniref:Uncharacterized protein n=1 Tax=Scyliorhinus torazame TaxID=75743 RepID=A0A401Q0X3_SCYTO|nr:hypothetical protein [Scyliorhinus torazame]
MHCLQLIALNYFVRFTALAEIEVFRAPGSSVHFPGVNEDQRDQAKNTTVREVWLWIIDELAKASILSNSSSLASTIALTCIPPEQIIIIVAAIAGLVLSPVSLLGLMLLCCSKEPLRQAPMNYGRQVFRILLFSNISSLVAIVVALASWIAIKGAASVSVMALIFVVSLLVLALTYTISLWSLKHQCVTAFLKCAAFRGLLDTSCATCPFIVIAISIAILAEEIQQNTWDVLVTFSFHAWPVTAASVRTAYSWAIFSPLTKLLWRFCAGPGA